MVLHLLNHEPLLFPLLIIYECSIYAKYYENWEGYKFLRVVIFHNIT